MRRRCFPFHLSLRRYYEYTKLANVYFAYELQRRLGLRGVTSCVADPGGVRSNIWTASPLFKKGLYRCAALFQKGPSRRAAQRCIPSGAGPRAKALRRRQSSRASCGRGRATASVLSWSSTRPAFCHALPRRRTIIDATYSPPWDGAKPVVHAATVRPPGHLLQHHFLPASHPAPRACTRSARSTTARTLAAEVPRALACIRL